MSKVAIVLKSHGNNKYSFQEISEIFPEENNIKITNNNYNKLANGEEINIATSNINPEENLYLIFDEEELINKAKKNGESEEQSKKSARQSISTIGNNLENITLDTAGNMSKIKLSFANEKKKEFDINSIDPDEVIKTIQEKVIAQDDTVETIVRNIYNNQLVIESQNKDAIKTQKVNAILDGPTGTGKTLIMNEVAANMNLPIYITSSTMYTTTGYQGVELQQMLEALLAKTGGDLEAAERGIIVLDEFDKLGYGDGSSSLEIRKAVQQDLLTYLSGSTFTVNYKGKSYDFDTSRITFICLGAFTDYREKQNENLDENGNYKLNAEDYINAGIMREIVGRLPLITSTNALDKEALKRILSESSISPTQQLIEFGKSTYNTTIIFDDEVIDEIVDIAYATKTGARSLQSIVASIKTVILKELQNNRKNGKAAELHIPMSIMGPIRKNHLREVPKK